MNLGSYLSSLCRNQSKFHFCLDKRNVHCAIALTRQNTVLTITKPKRQQRMKVTADFSQCHRQGCPSGKFNRCRLSAQRYPIASVNKSKERFFVFRFHHFINFLLFYFLFIGMACCCFFWKWLTHNSYELIHPTVSLASMRIIVIILVSYL